MQGLPISNQAIVEDAHNRLAAAHAQLADGYGDGLIIRKGITHRRLGTAFLKMTAGEHLLLSEMEYDKARWRQRAPLRSKGLLAVDGEQINYRSVVMHGLASHARVFCR